jgi:hypothetical protein
MSILSTDTRTCAEAREGRGREGGGEGRRDGGKEGWSEGRME